jgi:NAD(P)-dependent dehydrogenase (short-subunit alcohol dehydrogenase family)
LSSLTPEQAKGMFEHITNHLPMKRVAHADELAKAALFLASDESSFMLGSEVAVDGGMAQL